MMDQLNINKLLINVESAIQQKQSRFAIILIYAMHIAQCTYSESI